MWCALFCFITHRVVVSGTTQKNALLTYFAAKAWNLTSFVLWCQLFSLRTTLIFFILHSCPNNWTVNFLLLLVAFAKLRKATVSSVMSLRPHRTHRFPLGRIFREIWYVKIFREYIEKIELSLKTDKKNGYFTRRPVYICDSTELIVNDDQQDATIFIFSPCMFSTFIFSTNSCTFIKTLHKTH